MSEFLSGSDVDSCIKELFPCLGLGHMVLGNVDVDSVLNKARANSVIVETEQIPFWDQFETSARSFDDDFKQLLFSHSTTDDEFIIVSDALGDHGIAFKKHEFDFILDNATEIDFFQRQDYILVNINLRRMLLIHHSGYLFQLGCDEGR